MHSAVGNDGCCSESRRRPATAPTLDAEPTIKRRRSRSLPAPEPPEIDTQSDTLRSARPRDSWTPSEAKVRDSLSKRYRWTSSDAGGTAGTDLLIRVSLVRSQRGPPNRINNLRGFRAAASLLVSALCQHGRTIRRAALPAHRRNSPWSCKDASSSRPSAAVDAPPLVRTDAAGSGALLSLSVNVSPSSSSESSVIGTDTVFDLSPAAKVSVPLVVV